MVKANQFIHSLTDLPADAELIGGKALNLKELTSMNVRIPETAVIPGYVYEQLVQPGGLDPSEITEKIDSVDFSRFIPSIQRYLKSRFGNVGIAVRSSSNFEDQKDKSFSGQYESYINHSIEDVENAIRSCWRSLWTEHAISYRHAPDKRLTMSVIIQPYIRGTYPE